ncbi:hypothetical protein BDV25DRAFT_172394 [Aspergillus avenaceus]|uniref:Transcription factor domain-containing protein n=1 Tax=Aspergillus avenaceus TaxID=36643 RepID=A0A5N6U719_ASPAV|nr:hypothetical protein BDV25DRAFT_172394 [Aspergillus avenaceus]
MSSVTVPPRVPQDDRISALEERLRELEDVISSSFRSLRGAIQHVSTHVGLTDGNGGIARGSTDLSAFSPSVVNDPSPEPFGLDREEQDLVGKGIVSLHDCRALFDFYGANCSEVIAYYDNTLGSFEEVRRSPLLLAAMCTIGARASAPRLYDRCLKETYFLIQQTLLGPVPSLESLKGILLMAVWHKNNRLWGLALSISYQMRLPEAALDLADRTKKLDEHSIMGNIQEQPMMPNTCQLLQTYNQELESWYRRTNQEIDPIYQTFSKPQDRNRLEIPYDYGRIYINGSVLQGLKPDTARKDPLRAQFIRAAVDAGKALVECALHSISYQTSLNYSIDYSGSSLGLAINFLFRATCIAYDCIDVDEVMRILGRARDMFESAKLAGKVDEVNHILDLIADIKRNMDTTVAPNLTSMQASNDRVDEYSDFFLNARLPLSEFSLDESAIEDILMYTGE